MFRTWSNVIRSLLIIINIISIVPGCLLIYSSFKVSGDNSLNSNQPNNPILTYVCIIGAALGSIIVLKSLLGLYGAIKRSKSILATYATILSIIILSMIALVIFTYTTQAHKNKTRDDQELDKADVNSTVAMYNYVDPTDLWTTFIDFTQKKFACCGINSPNDWMEYSIHKIPKSCCTEPVESSLPVFKYCAESDYKIGCWRPIQDYFYETVVPITRDFILVKIYFNVFCTSLACLLIRSIRKDLDVV